MSIERRISPEYRITPPNIVITKPVRHMTFGEYNETIVPVIAEIRSILRKKYIVVDRFFDLWFYTRPQFISMYDRLTVDTISKHKESSADTIEWFKSDFKRTCYENLDAQSIKEDKAPDGMVERFAELLGTLYGAFPDIRSCFNWTKYSKSHAEFVRCAMDSDYITDIMKGDLSIEELEDIALSVNVRIPKRVYEFKIASAHTIRCKLQPSSLIFMDALESALQPHKNNLYDIRRTEIEKLLERFPVSKGSEFPYDCIASTPPHDCKALMLLCTTDFDKAIEQICENFYNDLVLTFVYRIENKLNIFNTNHECVSIELQNTTFNCGTLETTATLSYRDGMTILNKSSLIYAEGEVVTGHFRYITNFWINNKKQSQSQLDSI